MRRRRLNYLTSSNIAIISAGIIYHQHIGCIALNPVPGVTQQAGCKHQGCRRLLMVR